MLASGKLVLQQILEFHHLDLDNLLMQEEDLERNMNDLADEMGRLLSQVAPDAFQNLTVFSSEADSCRIGNGPEPKPFSGVTSVVDFCAHSHHDRHNINGGCTMVGLNRPCLV